MEKKQASAEDSSGCDVEIDYKVKYEEAQAQVRKLAELSNRACQDYHEMQKRFIVLSNQHETLKSKLKEKDDLLKKLQDVSETVCVDYESLKAKYQEEKEAIEYNMKKASKWYNENKTLRRQSAMLTQKMMSLGALQTVDINIDNVTGSLQNEDEDLQSLLSSVQSLQAKLEDVETKYKNEICKGERKDIQIEELQQTIKQLESVSIMVVKEFDELQNEQITAVETARHAITETQNIRKERNALARKSALLLMEVPPENKLMKTLEEVETLSKELEENKLNYERQLEAMKLELSEKENDEVEAGLRQQINILESQLDQAEQKQHSYQRDNEQYKQQIKNLEYKLERSRKNEVNMLPSPPPPPPPPPPPHNPIRSLMNIISATKRHKKKVDAKNADVRSDVINEMMAKIKTGNLHLKPAKKVEKEPQENKVAINEMMMILSSLKKTSNSSLESVKSSETSSSGELSTKSEQQRNLTAEKGPEELLKNGENSCDPKRIAQTFNQNESSLCENDINFNIKSAVPQSDTTETCLKTLDDSPRLKNNKISGFKSYTADDN